MTAPDSQQLTLTGDETDARRVPPLTLRYCRDCDEVVLASKWVDHNLTPIGRFGGGVRE